jgi:hypothetical protein
MEPGAAAEVTPLGMVADPACGLVNAAPFGEQPVAEFDLVGVGRRRRSGTGTIPRIAKRHDPLAGSPAEREPDVVHGEHGPLAGRHKGSKRPKSSLGFCVVALYEIGEDGRQGHRSMQLAEVGLYERGDSISIIAAARGPARDA